MDNLIEVRKIQMVGKSSLAVTIPRRWAELLGLKAGSPVNLELRGGEITIIPIAYKATSDQQRIVRVGEEDDVNSVIRRVISSFIKGSQTIRVLLSPGKDRSFIDILVKEINMRIPMVETLVHENEVKVTVLSPSDELPLSSFINRMSNIVSGMFRDAIRLVNTSPKDRPSIVEDIVDRDYDVDRNYLMVHRLINMTINGLMSIRNVGISERAELLSYLLVSKSIERSGDHSWRIAQWSLELEVIDEEVADELIKLGDQVVDLHRSSVSAFLSRDVERAQKVLEERDYIADRRIALNRLIRKYNIAGPLNLIVESVGRLAAYAYDIAEITLDTYY